MLVLSYKSYLDLKEGEENLLLAGTFETDWHAHYLENELYEQDTTVAATFLKNKSALTWRECYDLLPPSKSFVSASHDFNYVDGIIVSDTSQHIPHNRSIFSIRNTEENKRTKLIMERMVGSIHDAMQRIVFIQQQQQLEQLHIDMLKNIVIEGNRSKAADAMLMSLPNFNYHAKKIFRILGVHSIEAAVSTCYRIGIDLNES